MTNRTAQVLAATLAFLLIVLVGATIFILLSRPAEPGPTPTPTPTTSGAPSFTPTGPSSSATVLPTGSASATPTPIVLPTDTPGPTVAPTITPTPSPSPSPSPSPTPSPTLPPPTSLERHATVVDFGIDRRSDITAVQRTIKFGVDGPSLISARLSGVNAGRVRMCMLRDDTNDERECVTFRGGTLTRAVFDTGHSDWIVTLIGASQVLGQRGTIDLIYNAQDAYLELDSFRFLGASDPPNNGFTVVFGDNGSAPGTFGFRATIDDGRDNPYPWHFKLAVDDAVLLEESGGPSTVVNLSSPVEGGTAYNVVFEEPEAAAGGGTTAVFVGARLTWP